MKWLKRVQSNLGGVSDRLRGGPKGLAKPRQGGLVITPSPLVFLERKHRKQKCKNSKTLSMSSVTYTCSRRVTCLEYVMHMFAS